MTTSDARPDPNWIIRVEGLSREYEVGGVVVRALCGVDLRVALGERLAVVGPSGSGKSTLLSILGCVERPTAGSFIFDGTAVQRRTDDQLAALRAREIGFIFQSFHLLPQLNAVQNVALGLLYAGWRRVSARERAVDVLKDVGLGSRLEHRPAQLSGGEQQRVAIARAIAGRPRLVLADEPTGNLDGSTARMILDVLLQTTRGTTLVVVTHS